MKKFVLMTIGFVPPTPEIMQSWMTWFASIADITEDQVGLMNGREITKEGMKDLQMDLSAITGYIVIRAENLETALEVAKGCPMVVSTRVYEVWSH
jgi:hypothetical protein